MTTETEPTTRRYERALREWLARERRRQRVRDALLIAPVPIVLVTTAVIVGLNLSPATPADTLPRCTDAIADAGGSCYGEPLPPCPTEDSDNCYWDATVQGNGIGRSFIVVDGHVTYDDE